MMNMNGGGRRISHFQKRLSPRKPYTNGVLSHTASATTDFVQISIQSSDNPYVLGASTVLSPKYAGGWCGFRSDTTYLAALLVCWYASCVTGTIVNARMMKSKEFAFPVILSVIHLVVTVVADWLIIVYRGVTLPTSWKILVYSVPVAMFLAVTKCLTYVSYSKVPASLTQTVRAAAPIFSVLITKFWHSRVPSFCTCMSLVPITAGVCLSAVSEIDFEVVGFMSAALATAAGVLQTTYTKDTLVNTDIDALVFHMYTSLVALILTAPFGFSEYRQFWWVITDSDYDGPVRVRFAFSTLLLICISVVCIYGQNIASIYFLKEVNVLTHTVANTLKRLVIILGSVMYFHHDVTPHNAAGMAIALAGFGGYGVSRSLDTKRRRRHQKKRVDYSLSPVLKAQRTAATDMAMFNIDALPTRRLLSPV